jgi:hypothetical protein
LWKTCGQLVEHLCTGRGRKEKIDAPRQSIRGFPALWTNFDPLFA